MKPYQQKAVPVLAEQFTDSKKPPEGVSVMHLEPRLSGYLVHDAKSHLVGNGDWVVKYQGGRIEVVSDAKFAERFEEGGGEVDAAAFERPTASGDTRPIGVPNPSDLAGSLNSTFGGGTASSLTSDPADLSKSAGAFAEAALSGDTDANRGEDGEQREKGADEPTLQEIDAALAEALDEQEDETLERADEAPRDPKVTLEEPRVPGNQKAPAKKANAMKKAH